MMAFILKTSLGFSQMPARIRKQSERQCLVDAPREFMFLVAGTSSARTHKSGVNNEHEVYLDIITRPSPGAALEGCLMCMSFH